MTSEDGPADFGRLLRVFACAAADPRLTGVLLFDVPPQLTGPVADVFAAVVAGFVSGEGTGEGTGEGAGAGEGADPAGPAGGGPRPAAPADGARAGRLVRLGAAVREDDLWSRTRLLPAAGRITVDVLGGDLVEAEPDAPPRAVVVPDLARLPLPGLRAAVTVLGADVAAVERHGVSQVWRPRARWLAFCRSDDAGRVSPHLLDRFPLRLRLPDLVLPADPSAAWRASSEHRVLADLRNRAATGRWAGGPAPDDAALARAAREAPGERRAVALARIARALAALGGAPATTEDHVTEAARLIGLRPAAHRPPSGPEPSGPPPPRAEPPPPAAQTSPPQPRMPEPDAATRTAELPAPGPEETVAPFTGHTPGRTGGDPYPEDEAEPLREFAPLRAAWRRSAGPAAERGPVTGIRRATDLRDLALVPTVVEAAKYQRLRGRARGGSGFVITPADLRSHARAAEPERMLVLLLDHTSRPGWEWPQALAPYVRWAYAARATVAVVEVGGASAADELRAQTFQARNVLDPRLAEALYRPAGRATPLAHGLLVAAQLVRRAFQQQPTSLAEAWLVVATDGRGNVPLRTSLTGRHDGPVGRRGVQDALTAAGQLGAMGRMRLHTVVLDTGARPYADLPFTLADALGGSVVAAEPGAREDTDAAV
ncbi:protoporphyrin IX magnesium-chelatase [Actinacidiphila yanglinensis]|uniref:Protoporphyrin IX magnesium-chelatase n=1 Tax=Actinacidiphila yanglinensis TaxID=310779 RepID=A0A1H5VJL5_9ACTN|nr:magnesium chelatase [Actinacidiphila yanglinensis]SEF87021.1 protoporphyrin IX magnesium-chelatase [Actinacidiphila yanglinensis]